MSKMEDIETRITNSLKRTYDMFQDVQTKKFDKSQKLMRSIKIKDEYSHVVHLKETKKDHKSTTQPTTKTTDKKSDEKKSDENSQALALIQEEPTTAIVPHKQQMDFKTKISKPKSKAVALIEKKRRKEASMRPTFHPHWKLMRVISGHLGWVRAVSVDPSNEWFATGSTDRTIKIWDLASGTLKLTLTGHISAIRGLVVSDRHPYIFSVGEDKQVKCWDLEQNKCIRHYHGHLSGVYCVALHPKIDVLVTGGRDSSARVWDIRTKRQIHLLTGHQDTVLSVACQSFEPQIITGSADSTIRLWDIVAGKTRAVLTNHKKQVRSLVIHPTEYTFASGAKDNLKKWKCPDGKFLQNFSGHNTSVNTMSINNENVLVSGGDDGSIYFWDWKTGYNFQQLMTTAQPGSLESEKGIFCSTFDQSGARLITGEADKTIKIWKEDPESTEERDPIVWNPNEKRTRY